MQSEANETKSVEDETKWPVVNFRLPAEELKALDAAADQDHRNRSSALRAGASLFVKEIENRQATERLSYDKQKAEATS